MTQAGDPPYPSGRYAAYLISVLFLAWVMAFLDRQIVTLLLPSLKADLGVSDTQVSLIQGIAFASIYAVAGMPLGWVADRTNRRNLLVAGIAFWSLATMACGLATEFWQLFAARMAVGLGEACLAPACVSMMADYFRPEQRGRAMGLMQAGTPVGSAASLFVGGWLLSALATGGGPAALVPEGWAPWKVVFLVIGAPGLLVAALVATLREPPRRTRPAPAGQAAVAGIGFLPFLRAHRLTLGLFLTAYSSVFVLGYAVSSWAPTVLMRIYGMAPKEAGALYGTMLLLCSATAGICSGLLSDALVRRRPLEGRLYIPLIGLPVAIAALLVLTTAQSAVVFSSALAVMTFLMSFVATSSYPALQDFAPSHLRGRLVALLLLLGNLVGLGCGPTFVALVTDRVFADEMMLQRSVGLVGLISASLALLLALPLPRLYGGARRREAEGRLSAVPAGA
jgi:MFS family permease